MSEPTTYELVDPPNNGDEREMLRGFVDYFRNVLRRKATGITETQSRLTVSPSPLHILGIVRHMAFVEQYWFAVTFHGLDEPFHWFDEHEVDRDFKPFEHDTLADALRLLDTEIERSHTLERAVTSLDQLATKESHGRAVSLRWILIHMVDEYARHCGHADLIREAIDGAVGD